MKKKFLTSTMVIAFVLAGCGTPPPASNYIMPQQINEPTIEDITPVFETQIERVNNCDGSNPTYNVSYKTIETQKATFEVSVGAGGLVTGTPIPTALEVQLEAKITAALAKDYGLTTEKNHDLTLNNVQGTFMEHTITWKVARVKGLIEVVYGDGVAQVGFEKIANVELYNRTSKPLGCDGQGVIEVTATAPMPTIPSIPSRTVTAVVNQNCQAIAGIIPNSPEEVRAKFGIPSDKDIWVFYEFPQCQESPNGFKVEESPSLFTLQVPSGGCIDSYSGAKFSDATVPEQLGGGRRAYSGSVTTTSLTYRIAGCELKP